MKALQVDGKETAAGLGKPRNDIVSPSSSVLSPKRAQMFGKTIGAVYSAVDAVVNLEKTVLVLEISL